METITPLNKNSTPDEVRAALRIVAALSKPIDREHWIKKIQKLTGIAIRALKAEVSELRKAAAEQAHANALAGNIRRDALEYVYAHNDALLLETLLRAKDVPIIGESRGAERTDEDEQFEAMKRASRIHGGVYVAAPSSEAVWLVRDAFLGHKTARPKSFICGMQTSDATSVFMRKVDCIVEMIEAGWFSLDELRDPRYLAPGVAAHALPNDVTDEVAALDKDYAQVTVGGTTRYIQFMFDGSYKLLKPDTVGDLNSSNVTMVGLDEEGQPKFASTLDVWKAWPERRAYIGGMKFCPQGATADVFNTWTGFTVHPKKGDWLQSLLRQHIFENICGGDERYFAFYMARYAQMVQEPHVKPGCAGVYVGKKGTGKSKLFEVLAFILGEHAQIVTNQRHVTGNFNAHLASTLLLGVEEGFWAGDKQAEGTLKSMITDPKLQIERKGVDVESGDSYLRLDFNSNEDWVIPATEDERRYFVLRVGDRRRKDIAFFAALDLELKNCGYEMFLHELMTFDYSNVNLRDPPVTEELVRQILQAMKPCQRWYYDILSTGRIDFNSDVLGVKTASVLDLTVPQSSHMVVCSAIYEAARPHFRGHRGAVATDAMIGKFIADYTPFVKRRARCKITGQRAPKRSWVYDIPPLAELREAFAVKLGVSAVALFPEGDLDNLEALRVHGSPKFEAIGQEATIYGLPTGEVDNVDYHVTNATAA